MFQSFFSSFSRWFALWRYGVFSLLREQKKHPELCYYLMIPTHGNLGDHAIACATETILHSAGIRYRAVSNFHLHKMVKYRCANLFNGFPIFIHGGGNIGSLWPDCQKIMEEIVAANPDSTIAFLPNTAYFNQDSEGEKQLSQAKKIFNSHPRVFLYAREKTSYDFLKIHFPKVKLCPDLVLSLDKSTVQPRRAGCLLCLRSDKEKTLTEEMIAKIEKIAASLFSQVGRTDTYWPHKFRLEERTKILHQKFNEFLHAQCIITDRLHGMIFAAITGTPCVVLNSKSHKVRGCYEWIKQLPYIQFCDSLSQLEEVLRQLPPGGHAYDNSSLQRYYEDLKADLADFSIQRPPKK